MHHLYQRLCLTVLVSTLCQSALAVSLGPRPQYLVDQLPEGELKQQLQACQNNKMTARDFSIGHRGAPLQFPEHTRESYIAAARMGAGILECDVTFTKDKQLVCRHAQNDLHTSTNILSTELASRCLTPFSPAKGEQEAQAECRTSELTQAEFLSLNGKMDASNPQAKTLDEYINSTANWRTDLYANTGTLMTHAQSIELFKSLGVKFTPELKTPEVNMPFDGFSQADYAQKLIDDYKAAGVAPEQVFPQSFNLEDVLYWIKHEPEFGKQAVFLDDRYEDEAFNHLDASTWQPSMSELKAQGVNYLAPALWMLVTLDEQNTIVPSPYAKAAKAAGLKLIAWTLERSGPLHTGGGWYFQSIEEATTSDAAALQLLHVLASDIGVEGVFSDWPATTTFYANCMDLP